MGRLIPVIILFILLSSCRKSESDFIWEKSYGKGKALFIRSSADSGFTACGESGGKPYFVKLSKTRIQIFEFSSENQGLFSSSWSDTSGYITAGNTGGKMLIMRHSIKGNLLWEKSLDGGFNIDYTNLHYTGNGTLLAIGTAGTDSSVAVNNGLFFVSFDTTGNVISEKKITETTFISANDAAVDNIGNIFLALTRRSNGSKSKASVARFNNIFQKIWETSLSNNPDFGAASMAVKLDNAGNVYIAGKTELAIEGGILNNSFLASLTNSGAERDSWKKRYLENSNEGSALLFRDSGELMMLNRNCFIINIVDPANGTDAGRIKMFSLCDSYNTDALGEDFDISFDKNILVAGTRGGNFYLAIKSSQ